MAYVQEKLKPGYTGKFVISEHDASHLHFDFRLEFPVTSIAESLADYSGKRPKKGVEPTPETPDEPGNVLRSWAIPKHTFPGKKPLLATETENHAIQYWKFHGTIPSGYGAGTVKIIDIGTYTMEDVDFDKKYVFTLHGKSHTGTYALIKTGGKSFLWIKTKEQKKANLGEMIRRVASAIDYPRPTMNPVVWDIESGFPPKLRPDIKKKLLKPLFGAFNKAGLPDEKNWLIGIYLTGSMAGNTASETGDVDVDIRYNSSRIEKSTHELQQILKPLNNKKIKGTTLTTSYMILAPQDNPAGNGLYDILNDRWIQDPVLIPTNFDPDTAFAEQKKYALAIAKEIDILIRDIYRAVQDLKKIDEYVSFYRAPDAKRITALHRIQQLCGSLNDWYEWIWNLSRAIKIPPNVYPAFPLGPNWDARYIIFKYLSRYGYHHCVAMLYSLLAKDDHYLKIVDQFIPD